MLQHQHDTTRGSTATMNDLHTFKARAYTSRVNSQRYAICHTETDLQCFWPNHRKLTTVNVPKIRKTIQAFFEQGDHLSLTILRITYILINYHYKSI